MKEKGIRLHLLMGAGNVKVLKEHVEGDIATIFGKYNLSQSLNMLQCYVKSRWDLGTVFPLGGEIC